MPFHISRLPDFVSSDDPKSALTCIQEFQALYPLLTSFEEKALRRLQDWVTVQEYPTRELMEAAEVLQKVADFEDLEHLELEEVERDGRRQLEKLETAYDKGDDDAWSLIERTRAFRARREMACRHIQIEKRRIENLSDDELETEIGLQGGEYRERKMFCDEADRWERKNYQQKRLNFHPYSLAVEEQKKRAGSNLL